MKKIITIAIVAVIAILYAFTAKENATWTIDKAHAKLGFSATHMMVSEVEGWFKNFDAKITTSNPDFTDAVVEMTAEAKSINTDNEKRDNHLRSADFFEVEKYPNITFKSKSFKKLDAKNYKVTGDLTMHGITKVIDLNAFCMVATHPMTKQTIAGFKITGKIKRSDFKIGSSMADIIVGDEIMLLANAEFFKD